MGTTILLNTDLKEQFTAFFANTSTSPRRMQWLPDAVPVKINNPWSRALAYFARNRSEQFEAVFPMLKSSP